jgi:hypothetical protein
VSDAWIEIDKLKARLGEFFEQRRAALSTFGSTVNQTFEAFVFAQVLGWYEAKAWHVEIVNPYDSKTKRRDFKFKFNTRGHPAGYSYAICTSPDGLDVVQVRHQLRVATRHYQDGARPRANVCLDVAVIRDTSVDGLDTDDHVTNAELVTFGEAKHMSAFAELVASFIGMVHELQPERLRPRRRAVANAGDHPSPFLFVSGKFWVTAEGLITTIERRKIDVKVYNRVKSLSAAIALPTDNAPRRRKRQRKAPEEA